MDKEQFKITYNYSKSDDYEDITHWLIGCEIIWAKTYEEAQNKFRELFPRCVIRDIELVREN